MRDSERFNKLLQEAHKKYVNWWLPIDVAGGSFLAPMSFESFCQTLLLEDVEWWERWVTIDENSKYDKKNEIYYIKSYILKMLIKQFL